MVVQWQCLKRAIVGEDTLMKSRSIWAGRWAKSKLVDR